MKLVFIHGGGGCGDSWYYQKQRFRDADAPDLPGHPAGKTCDSIEEYSDWLHGYIYENRYTDVVLAGHSMGGGIMLLYAYKYPQDLKDIMSVGSGARLRVLPSTIESISGKINDTPGWIRDLVEPLYAAVDGNVRNILMPRLEAVGPAVQLSDMQCCDKFDMMDKVSRIKIPALAVVGDRDNMTPPKYAQYLASNMPDCRMAVIESATHLAYLEQPQQVNGAIEKFLEELV